MTFFFEHFGSNFLKHPWVFNDTLCSLGQYLNWLETCLVVGLNALPGA